MDKLPKHIADMVGIVTEEQPQRLYPLHDEPMLSITYDPDGTITFAYDGAVVGWVNEINDPASYDAKYRAVAANGHVGHFWSIDSARGFLFSEAF